MVSGKWVLKGVWGHRVSAMTSFGRLNKQPFLTRCKRSCICFFPSMKGKEIPKVKIAPVGRVCWTAMVVPAPCKAAVMWAGRALWAPVGCLQGHMGGFKGPEPPVQTLCSHWLALGCLDPTCRSAGSTHSGLCKVWACTGHEGQWPLSPWRFVLVEGWASGVFDLPEINWPLLEHKCGDWSCARSMSLALKMGEPVWYLNLQPTSSCPPAPSFTGTGTEIHSMLSVGRDLKIPLFPLSCHGQGYLPLMPHPTWSWKLLDVYLTMNQTSAIPFFLRSGSRKFRSADKSTVPVKRPLGECQEINWFGRTPQLHFFLNQTRALHRCQ